ncbi:MAG: MerR family transcriptional regulator [Candidatus Omnitrophica bacterium]|nr:MerR family transcriptional regulator [Candidatus Omnitrophota bacterium]
MAKKLVYSKEIADRYNIPYSTVTHYTNMGFFTVVKRRGNKRLYDDDEIRARLDQISRLINKGYPLRLIRSILFKEKSPHELL